MSTIKSISNRNAFRWLSIILTCLLFASSLPSLNAGDCSCGCDSIHHHCHHCCPPGLLDRLNNLSDAVECRWQQFMHRIDRFGGPLSCDECDTACDACDHPLSSWINSSIQKENHVARDRFQTHQHPNNDVPQHSKRARQTPSQEPPVPKNFSHPVKTLPDSNTPRDHRQLPDWLKDPFKDEARSQKAQRVRAASSQSIVIPRTLRFDPRAEQGSRRTLDELLEEVMLQGTIADAEKWRRRVAVQERTSSTTIRRHLKDESIQNTSGESVSVSEVVTASAFAPVMVAPVPNPN